MTFKKKIRLALWYSVQRNFIPEVQDYFRIFLFNFRRISDRIVSRDFLRKSDLINKMVNLPINKPIYFSNSFGKNSSDDAYLGMNRHLPSYSQSVLFEAFENFRKLDYKWNQTRFYKNFDYIWDKFFPQIDKPEKKVFFDDLSTVYFSFDKTKRLDKFGLIDQKFLDISISIGKSGQPLLLSGIIALIIHTIEGSKFVKAEVVSRHNKWLSFKKRLLMQNNNSLVYSPLPHYDLEHIETATKGRRFEIIKSQLSRKRGTVLDIGSAWGYYCHCFEDLGFDCTAVENDRNALYFMRNLRKSCSKTFSIIARNIFRLRKDELKYDIILAFSIFHHFLRTKNLYDDFIDFLKKIDAKEMYFLSYLSDTNPRDDMYKTFSPEEFAKLIISESKFQNYELLADSLYQKRVLYKIY